MSDELSNESKAAIAAYNFTPVKMYPNEVGWDEFYRIAGLSVQRCRALVREGKVPSAVKNENGHWRFDPDKLSEFFTKRPARGAGVARTAADGKKAWKIRLTAEQYTAILPALEAAGITLEMAYKKSKKARVARNSAARVAPPVEVMSADEIG